MGESYGGTLLQMGEITLHVLKHYGLNFSTIELSKDIQFLLLNYYNFMSDGV